MWYDIPAVNLEPPPSDGTTVHKKYRGSRPRGQSLLRYQCVCDITTTYREFGEAREETRSVQSLVRHVHRIGVDIKGDQH